MPSVHFSKSAENDLRGILTYTVDRWGKEHAAGYMSGLDGLFALLRAKPGMGRFYSSVHPRWQRIEHASHVVLYSLRKDGLTIQRVLHKRQLLERPSR
jgi:plasmid stabilization system protein ParE